MRHHSKTISFIAVNALFSCLIALPTGAAPTRDQVPLIATEGEKGSINLAIYQGKGSEMTTSPRMGTVPIKVCESTDCELFTMNYFIDVEGWTGHQWMWGQVTIGERFNKKAVTMAAPIDLTDVTKGFSAPSNAVTGWGDPNAYYRSVKDKPFAQGIYQSLSATSIGKVDMCLNFSVDRTFTTGADGNLFFDTRGYSEATYTILEDGKPFRTGNLPAATTGPTGPPSTLGLSVPMCGSGTLGSSLMSSFEGLSGGKTYVLTYALRGTSGPDISGTLTFITPSGCPTSDPNDTVSPRPYNFAVISSDNLFQSVVLVGNSWRLAGLVGKSLAPIYLSGNKTQPFKGRLAPNFLATTTERWRYIKEIDDWAQVLDQATPLSDAQVLAQTVYAGCTSAQVKVALSVDTSTIPQSDQGCSVKDGQVVPTSQKLCVLTAKVERLGVTASAVRKTTTPVSLLVAYSIATIGNFALTTTTSPTVLNTLPVVTTTQPKQSTSSVVRNKSLSASTLAKTGKLVVAKSDKVTLKISTGSKFCKVANNKLFGLKKGICKVLITKVSSKKNIKRATVNVTVK